MSMEAKHPMLSGTFETTAKKWDKFAQKNAEKLETKRRIRDVCEAIAADSTHDDAIRSEALKRATSLSSELKFDEALHQNFESKAADFRQLASRAREFDPLLDKMEAKACRQAARGPKARRRKKAK